MSTVAVVILAAAGALVAYTYVGYPLILLLLPRRRRAVPAEAVPPPWPAISITIPVHNEAANLPALLDNLLALEYPGPRQILVVSDASTDGSDAVVTRYASRGVELLRLPERRGKTAAENAALSHLTGAIVINTDASARIDRRALPALVAALSEPGVGLASGCDVSVGATAGGKGRERAEPNGGEASYTSFEMWLRERESAVGGIVGASGCLYAIRADLHGGAVPARLSRDFAAALVAREHGYRAVSVPAARCYVPRVDSLRSEYFRKVRTITRGLATLYHWRHLLNPRRFGRFAWMLWSHKVCRWAVPWVGLVGIGAGALAAPAAEWARALLGAVAGLGVLAGVGWWWPEGKRPPRLAAFAAYVVAGNLAVVRATARALTQRGAALWEPTRRPIALAPPSTPQHHRGPVERDLEVLER